MTLLTHKRFIKMDFNIFLSIFRFAKLSCNQEIITNIVYSHFRAEKIKTHISLALTIDLFFFGEQINIDKKLKLCTLVDYSNELLFVKRSIQQPHFRLLCECMIGFVGLKSRQFSCVWMSCYLNLWAAILLQQYTAMSNVITPLLVEEITVCVWKRQKKRQHRRHFTI